MELDEFGDRESRLPVTSVRGRSLILYHEQLADWFTVGADHRHGNA